VMVRTRGAVAHVTRILCGNLPVDNFSLLISAGHLINLIPCVELRPGSWDLRSSSRRHQPSPHRS
jgi:hypothetical protein